MTPTEALASEETTADPLPQPLANAVASSCEAVSHNLNGQKLGRKGRYTRERILAATLALLDEGSEEPLTMAAVAQRASLGMTSLYNYFNDLSELILAVLEPVMATAEDAYIGMLREYWPDSAVGKRCLAFVLAYHDFWLKHSRLLHLRNSLADQENRRMMAQRVESSLPVISLLVEQMDGEPQRAGSPATSMATMALIGIERSITIATDRKLPDTMGWDFSADEQRFIAPGARLLELAIRDMRGGADH